MICSLRFDYNRVHDSIRCNKSWWFGTGRKGMAGHVYTAARGTRDVTVGTAAVASPQSGFVQSTLRPTESSALLCAPSLCYVLLPSARLSPLCLSPSKHVDVMDPRTAPSSNIASSLASSPPPPVQ